MASSSEEDKTQYREDLPEPSSDEEMDKREEMDKSEEEGPVPPKAAPMALKKRAKLVPQAMAGARTMSLLSGSAMTRYSTTSLRRGSGRV